MKFNLALLRKLRFVKKICDQIGVIFLQRDTIVIDNIRFAGCTLWSNASKEDLFYTNDVGRAFKTPEEFLPCHQRDLEFLKQQSADVFVTHYLPSYRCIHERFLSFMGNACFATDLEDLLKPPLRYWFHGHTHEAVDETIIKVRIIANPHGYPGERKLTSFTDKSIKICVDSSVATLIFNYIKIVGAVSHDIVGSYSLVVKMNGHWHELADDGVFPAPKDGKYTPDEKLLLDIANFSTFLTDCDINIVKSDTGKIRGIEIVEVLRNGKTEFIENEIIAKRAEENAKGYGMEHEFERIKYLFDKI